MQPSTPTRRAGQRNALTRAPRRVRLSCGALTIALLAPIALVGLLSTVTVRPAGAATQTYELQRCDVRPDTQDGSKLKITFSGTGPDSVQQNSNANYTIVASLTNDMDHDVTLTAKIKVVLRDRAGGAERSIDVPAPIELNKGQLKSVSLSAGFVATGPVGGTIELVPKELSADLVAHAGIWGDHPETINCSEPTPNTPFITTKIIARPGPPKPTDPPPDPPVQPPPPPPGACSYLGDTYGPARADSTFSVSGPLEYWWDGSGYGLCGKMKWTYSNGLYESNGADWKPALIPSHTYLVEAYIPSEHATAHALYSVTDGAGVRSDVVINQQNYSNAFRPLGRFNTYGGSIGVHLSDQGDPKYSGRQVGADAMRFTDLGTTLSAPGTPVAINTTPNSITIGWAASTGGKTPISYRVLRDGSNLATTTATSFGDTGLTPGATHTYTIQAVDKIGMVTTSPSVALATLEGVDVTLRSNGRSGWTLDDFGRLVPFGGAPPVPADQIATWANFNIARRVVLYDDNSGYVLDGWGGIHPFWAASATPPPTVNTTTYWHGWDIARDLQLLPNRKGGYLMDGRGGIHRFSLGTNPLPPEASVTGYWPTWDIARAIALLPNGKGGYTLDGYGGIHAFATGTNPRPPQITNHSYWPGQDIARDLIVSYNGKSGYTLDGYGGIHPFAAPGVAGPPPVALGRYLPGQDLANGLAVSRQAGAVSGVVAFADQPSGPPAGFGPGVRARGVALLPGSSTAGYMLLGDGTITPFGGAPPVQDVATWTWDIARAIVLRADGKGGYVLDGWGGIHAFAIGTNPQPPPATVTGYWPGRDIARSIVLRGNTGGYTLDGQGGIHPFAIGTNPKPPAVSGANYWTGYDVAAALARGVNGGVVLDSYGATHPFH